LAVAPADRYASAEEMSSALDRAISAPHAATGMGTVRGGRARWRERVWQGAAMVGIAASAVLAWQVWRAPARSGDRDGDGAVRRTSILLPDSIPLAFVGEAPARVGRRSLALSRDGRLLVYVGWYRSRTHLFVRPMDDERIRRLEGTEGAFGPFFSPNGQWIAFFSGDKLHKVAVQGGAPVVLASAPQTYGGAWLDDGRIVFGPNEGNLVTVSESGGSTSPYDQASPFSLKSPEAVQGGRRLIGTAGSGLASHAANDTAWTRLGDSGFVGFERDEGPTRAASPQLLGDEYIVAGDLGRLYALRYNPVRHQALSAAVTLDESVRQETSDFAAQFALGREGTLVYASGPYAARGLLVTADRRGRVDTLSFAAANYWNPAFSPDGRRVAVNVAVAEGMELRVLDVDTKESSTLHRDKWIASPRWSADGRRISFNAPWKVMEVRAQGGGLRTEADSTHQYARSLDDRLRLEVKLPSFFARVVGPGTASAVLKDFSGGAPEFSPDGRWLVWFGHARASGGEQVVTALPPGGPVFPVTPGGSGNCRWMPAGNELVCAREDGYLHAVPLTFRDGEVHGGTPRRLTNQHLLDTPYYGWDLSRDGQRLLYIVGSPVDTTTRLTVVTNFNKVVEQKLAAVTVKAGSK
ncbi:MAG: hypothetical protein P3B98_10795, partial [Gemmatimonadota bacterium]|nr:hypothetical protein [Gemmatimonadota bacterium]